MRTYQEEDKEFGDAVDEVTHELARLSKVLDDAGEPLRSDDTRNGARARNQTTLSRPRQPSPSEQSAHKASKIAARFRSNKAYNCERELK